MEQLDWVKNWTKAKQPHRGRTGLVSTVSCLEKTPFYGGLPSSTTLFIAPARCLCELFRKSWTVCQDPNTRWDYCVRAKRMRLTPLKPGESALTVDFVIYWVTCLLIWSSCSSHHWITHLWKIKLLLLEVSADFTKPHFVSSICSFLKKNFKPTEMGK